MKQNFDDIRPYNDDEVKEKIEELASEPQFEYAMSHIFKGVPFKMVKRQLGQISSIREFQIDFMLPILKIMVSSTTQGLSWSGDQMDNSQHHLFLSNHRDIVLDSALTNYALAEKGLDTAEIAIGSNLLSPAWVETFVKLNKSFTVTRGVEKEKKVEASYKLSSYIQHTCVEKQNSIWIAQREGRSKDGNDRTNPSLLKMLCLSSKEPHPIDYLKKLNIRTVSASYEYNPCDAMTLPELYAKFMGEKYEKAEGEDLKSMILGVQGEKGHVHIGFSNSINEELESLREIDNKNAFFQTLAELLDKRIYKNYKLFKTNYIAYDLLKDNKKYESEYTEEELNGFKIYMDSKIEAVKGDRDVLHQLFLQMYANPVINKMAGEK